MDILLYLFIFFLGLAVGSFLNCVIYRLEKEESFLWGKSFCPHCRHTLSWQDLAPLLSFLILRGRCRYCQKHISFQYPLVELATGLLFLIIFLTYLHANIYTGVYLLILSCFLIIIFVYDLKHYIIPDKIVYPAIVIAFLYQLFRILPQLLNKGWATQPIENGLWFNFGSLLIFILSALGAAGFFLIIVLVSQGRWMGVGDIKLAFLMGLFLGWPNILVALFSAFLIGAIIGIGLMILGKKTLKSEVPFGPFLVTGTFLALFWGREIINFYVQKFSLSAF